MRSPLTYGTELLPSLALYVLQELLSQTGHYSERVRKDALTGMSELLARHPEELRRQVVITICLGACRSVSMVSQTLPCQLCMMNGQPSCTFERERRRHRCSVSIMPVYCRQLQGVSGTGTRGWLCSWRCWAPLC